MSGTILRVAPAVLSKEDAHWIHDLADRKDWAGTRYVVAAARLDPASGVAWLKTRVGREERQSARCLLLAALWSVAGPSELAWIVERYYSEFEPTYNAGGLQEGLVEQACRSQARPAGPLLRALILDRRFRSLSWSPTRAFALHAEQILGKKTADVKRYLRVEHRMGRSDYEMRTHLRRKFPVDTKHVQMQTKAFQEYLQAEVTRRQRT